MRKTIKRLILLGDREKAQELRKDAERVLGRLLQTVGDHPYVRKIVMSNRVYYHFWVNGYDVTAAIYVAPSGGPVFCELDPPGVGAQIVWQTDNEPFPVLTNPADPGYTYLHYTAEKKTAVDTDVATIKATNAYGDTIFRYISTPFETFTTHVTIKDNDTDRARYLSYDPSGGRYGIGSFNYVFYQKFLIAEIATLNVNNQSAETFSDIIGLSVIGDNLIFVKQGDVTNENITFYFFKCPMITCTEMVQGSSDETYTAVIDAVDALIPVHYRTITIPINDMVKPASYFRKDITLAQRPLFNASGNKMSFIAKRNVGITEADPDIGIQELICIECDISVVNTAIYDPESGITIDDSAAKSINVIKQMMNFYDDWESFSAADAAPTYITSNETGTDIVTNSGSITDNCTSCSGSVNHVTSVSKSLYFNDANMDGVKPVDYYVPLAVDYKENTPLLFRANFDYSSTGFEFTTTYTSDGSTTTTYAWNGSACVGTAGSTTGGGGLSSVLPLMTDTFTISYDVVGDPDFPAIPDTAAETTVSASSSQTVVFGSPTTGELTASLVDDVEAVNIIHVDIRYGFVYYEVMTLDYTFDIDSSFTGTVASSIQTITGNIEGTVTGYINGEEVKASQSLGDYPISYTTWDDDANSPLPPLYSLYAVGPGGGTAASSYDNDSVTGSCPGNPPEVTTIDNGYTLTFGASVSAAPATFLPLSSSGGKGEFLLRSMHSQTVPYPRATRSMYIDYGVLLFHSGIDVIANDWPDVYRDYPEYEGSVKFGSVNSKLELVGLQDGTRSADPVIETECVSAGNLQTGDVIAAYTDATLHLFDKIYTYPIDRSGKIETMLAASQQSEPARLFAE